MDNVILKVGDIVLVPSYGKMRLGNVERIVHELFAIWIKLGDNTEVCCTIDEIQVR